MIKELKLWRIWNKLLSLMQRKADISYYLDRKRQLNPFREAVKMALLYAVLGIGWIAFPDNLLAAMIKVDLVYPKINLYKGWTFVAVSVIFLFVYVFRRLVLFEGVAKELEVNLDKQMLTEQELHRLAYYDGLTKLPNRSFFEQRCHNLIEDGNHPEFAIVYMDVDNFKNINDTLGHMAGDMFLKNISGLLMANIGPDAFVSRIGGDEFAIIFETLHDRDEIAARVQKLLNHLRSPWVYEGQCFQISVSMGIVLYPENGNNLLLLLRNSDIAMHNVKKSTKNNYRFFTEEMNEASYKHIDMINELHKAIENEDFMLLYQPIVDMKTKKLIGVEALIRWVHPERGIISPLEFIPLAEEYGLIEEIEKWVIKNAFWQKQQWEEHGCSAAHLIMSINISGKSVMQYGFVNEIRNLLINTRLNSNEIQFEITETFLIENLDLSQKVINIISNMGIQIALDDFGSGYSSLTYLKKLPIDVVKLDRDFVKGIVNKGDDSVIVESVIKLTHDLGLMLVAEGIETDAQLTKLQSYECDYGQGYLFNKPVSSEAIEKIAGDVNRKAKHINIHDKIRA